MRDKDKRFSMVEYQEELINKLNSKDGLTHEVSWIFLIDRKNKMWKINSLEIEFVEEVKFKTFLPPFKEEVIAMANIQEKEVLMIDLESFIYKEKSYFRNNEITKEYKCLLLKDKKIGVLAHILPSYEEKNNELIEEIEIESLLRII